MKKWKQIYEWSEKVKMYLDEDYFTSSVDEEHPIVRRVSKRLFDPKYLQTKGKEQGRFDAESAFRKLRRRNQRQIIKRVGGVAAIFALIVGLVVMYKGELSQEKNSYELVEKITPTLQPGTNKAILKLADGRKLVLDDTLRVKLETKEGVVEIDSRGVVYGMRTDSLKMEKVPAYHVMSVSPWRRISLNISGWNFSLVEFRNRVALPCSFCRERAESLFERRGLF